MSITVFFRIIKLFSFVFSKKIKLFSFVFVRKISLFIFGVKILLFVIKFIILVVFIVGFVRIVEKIQVVLKLIYLFFVKFLSLKLKKVLSLVFVKSFVVEIVFDKFKEIKFEIFVNIEKKERDENEDFLVKVEKVRLDWLQKKFSIIFLKFLRDVVRNFSKLNFLRRIVSKVGVNIEVINVKKEIFFFIKSIFKINGMIFLLKIELNNISV